MQGDIQLDRISKRFGDVGALHGVTLEVARGEFFTLLGPSGCGKTTLLRLVAGFLRPTEGRIFLAGQDVTTFPPNRRPTALVFQSYALFPHMTVADNVAFGPSVRGGPRREIEYKVRQCLEVVRLTHLADRYPHQLSGGQQQRVALARAIAVEPKVLLLDEPLSALDAKLREAMQLELKRVQRELGITTIYVTHDQHEALGMSDRVAVMNHGRVCQVGPPQEIYRTPRGQFVAEFIGRVNLIAGTYSAEGPSLAAGGLRFWLQPTAGVRDGARMLLAVRPECLRFGRAPEGANGVRGVVDKYKFLGNGFQYFITVSPDLSIIVEDPTQVLRAKPGDEASLWWGPADSVLVAPEDGEEGAE